MYVKTLKSKRNLPSSDNNVKAIKKKRFYIVYVNYFLILGRAIWKRGKNELHAVTLHNIYYITWTYVYVINCVLLYFSQNANSLKLNYNNYIVQYISKTCFIFVTANTIMSIRPSEIENLLIITKKIYFCSSI